MLRDGALAAPGAHCFDAGGGALFVGTVGFGSEFDEGVERDLQGILAWQSLSVSGRVAMAESAEGKGDDEISRVDLLPSMEIPTVTSP